MTKSVLTDHIFFYVKQVSLLLLGQITGILGRHSAQRLHDHSLNKVFWRQNTAETMVQFLRFYRM